MTPQYIMKKSLCRKAHCFSSHVPEQGYIGTGSNIGADTKEEYVRQRMRSAQSEIDNMDIACGYAEPGYQDPAKGVIFANWNVFPSGIDRILEAYGYAIEWSDEWTACHGCNKAVRTSPDSWDWKPGWNQTAIENGEFLCLDCEPEVEESDE